MSKHDFTLEEFHDRRRRSRAAMTAAGFDWFVAIHPTSIHWLTGSDAKSWQEFQCLLISATSDDVHVLTREGERAEFEIDAWIDSLTAYGGPEPEDPFPLLAKLVQRLAVAGRVGYEVPAYYLHPRQLDQLKEVFTATHFVEATNLLQDLKMVKSPTEIAYVRKAAELADRGMEAFAKALAVGRTELQLAAEVYRELLAANSWFAASHMNLVSGERSCFSHGAPTDRALRRGDFGNIEYGATWKRHTATIGRDFSLGQPSPRARELHALTAAAGEAMIAAIRPGVPAIEPHLAAKKVIADAGLDRGRVHTSGYSLAPGFVPGWAEPMHLFGGSDYTLKAGMVVTVEPPVYLPEEKLGARVIDNVLITADGCERLSRLPRDVIVVG